MAAMGAEPMPGGWMLSSRWTARCGPLPSGAVSFLAMWLAMTAAMMTPSLAPALWRYREALADAGCGRADRLSAVAALGYFAAWAAFGLAAFALGGALAAAAAAEPVFARACPLLAAGVVVLAGAFQFSAWKRRALAGCRRLPARRRHAPPDAFASWRDGLRLGLRCACSCAGVTAAVLVVGAMDLRTMALATVAVTAERLAPDARSAARVVGAAGIGAGVALALRALVSG